ncbi:MAG: hypothetical protein QOI11_1635 [Candidatus Eremiobacteraeota bacterium]|nr:hypothetical protein [Candidatus Eremiobacteraeota bacterium]
MTRGSRLAAALLGWLLPALAGAAPAAAAVDAAARFPALQLGTPPVPGTDLSAAGWGDGPPLAGLTSVVTHRPAAAGTSARIGYDRGALYVVIVADQPGVPLTATQTTNGAGFGVDDFVGIGIDPTGNGSRVYYFETTPRGVRYQQSSESARFAPPWTARTATTPTGWRAELTIPLAALRLGAESVQRWRFNLVRRVAALADDQSWAYDPLMIDSPAWPVFSDSRFWPYLEGIRIAGAARPRPRGEAFLLGAAGPGRERYENAYGGFSARGQRPFGLDLNVPLTPTLAAVGALAPDYSNVEVDQQTIAPQEFRRVFSEYRPFFAQGATFFQAGSLASLNGAPNQVFYSPSIGPFDRGVKLEGTQGLQSIGLLNVAGAGFSDTVYGLKHLTADRTFGWWVDAVSAHHRAGSATADQRAGTDDTLDLGVNGRNLRTGFAYVANFAQERGSFVDLPRLARKSEDSLDVRRRNYEVYLGYKDIGPRWNPVDGYTNLADIRGPLLFLDLNGTPGGGGPIKRQEIYVYGDRFVDRSGAAHQNDAQLQFDLLFKNQFHLSGGPSTSIIRLYDDGASYVGYPFYRGGRDTRFNAHALNLGYRDGSPAPVDVGYSFGPFATFRADGTARPTFLQQSTFSTARTFGTRASLSVALAATRERFLDGSGGSDGQMLRRISLDESLGPEQHFSLALRSISGRGGFAAPGLNLAASYHRRFRNDAELFLDYGSPDAVSTLQRVLLKYVVRIGGGAGV